jgi:hypothetical protein
MLNYFLSDNNVYFLLYAQSDDLGSAYHRDVDSNMDLITRKVTERCSNIRDLIMFIKKFKGNTNHRVTSTEFRVLLVKFGIIFTVAETDRIFKVFDSDRRFD